MREREFKLQLISEKLKKKIHHVFCSVLQMESQIRSAGLSNRNGKRNSGESRPRRDIGKTHIPLFAQWSGKFIDPR